MSQYIDEVAVSKKIGIAIKTLRNWRVRGQGPVFYKAGRSVKYDEDEVDAWMRSQRVTSTSQAGEAA